MKSTFARRKAINSALLTAVLVLGLLPACQPQATDQATDTEKKPAEENQTAHAETADKPNEQQEVDVLIVGGGLSGLSTAYQLKKSGISYRILELAPRVGGRVRTGSYPEKLHAEVGLAEFWDGNPALEIVKELKVPMERVDTGLSSFIADGKVYPFKGKTNQEFIASLLNPEEYKRWQAWDAKMEKLLHEVEAGHASGQMPQELQALKALSFADWLKKENLPPLGLKLIHAVLAPEVGTPLERISALDGIAEWHLFVGKGAMPNHVVGGNQNLTEAIATHIGKEHISLNTQVTNVVDGPEGVEIRAVDTSNFKNKTFKAKHAVLAIPLYRLFELQFRPRLGDQIYQAIHSQSWGAYFTAHVILDKAAEKYWTIDGANALPLLTGGPLGVIYPGQGSGDGKHVLINLLITGDFAEGYNARTGSFDDVQKQIEAEFEKTFPGIGSQIRKFTFFRYHPRAIASWPVGRSRFDELSNGLRKAHGHLYFGGDFTESSHSDGAVIAAQRVSKQIAEVLGKK
jgi:monoamine oxidase